ncbi:MAG: hypothetical protein KAI66_12950 [Lentisphaeria bacterium]|nr:hypothetical protein [Lentisphaeria bacterium]
MHTRLIVLAALALTMLLPVGAEAQQREKQLSSAVKKILEHALQKVEPGLREGAVREYQAYFYHEAKRIEEILREEPAEAQEVASHIMRQCAELAELRREKPQEYERAVGMRRLENETIDLAERIRKAQGEQAKKLREELRAKLNAVFEKRQEQMAKNIEMMTREIEHMKRRRVKREAARERLIERRINQLLEEDDDLEW